MIKKILSFSTSGILILASITVVICCLHNNKQSEEFNKLENTNSDLHKKLAENLTHTADLEAEVERLFDENQIFTSMLAEIENEPGGHEILKKLWQDKTGYEESEEAQE